MRSNKGSISLLQEVSRGFHTVRIPSALATLLLEEEEEERYGGGGESSHEELCMWEA